jgi:hypothetical protein
MRHCTLLLRPMGISKRLLALAVLALAGCAAPTSALAQRTPEGRSARLQRNCPIAAQALAGGALTIADSTFWTISECDGTGPVVLAGLWAAPPSDPHQLELFVQASSSLLDQRLYDAVIARARSVGSSRSARVAAFRVLAMYLDPSVVTSQRTLETPASDTASISLFGGSSHGIGQRVGTHPLPGAYAAEIRLCSDRWSMIPIRSFAKMEEILSFGFAEAV